MAQYNRKISLLKPHAKITSSIVIRILVNPIMRQPLIFIEALMSWHQSNKQKNLKLSPIIRYQINSLIKSPITEYQKEIYEKTNDKLKISTHIVHIKISLQDLYMITDQAKIAQEYLIKLLTLGLQLTFNNNQINM